MKLQKFLMRVWLALTSMALFAGGWIALAHAPKPSQFKAADAAAMPTLAPIPSIEQLSLGQPFMEQDQEMVQRPVARLRTRGS